MTRTDLATLADIPSGASTFGFHTGAALTNGTTSMANITGLSAAVAASTNYRFRAVLFFWTAATGTGARFSVNGPASPTQVRFGGYVPSSAPTNAIGIASSFADAYDSPVFATTSGPGVANSIAMIEGILLNGSNSGTLIMRFASEVGGSDVSVGGGSYFELTEM